MAPKIIAKIKVLQCREKKEHEHEQDQLFSRLLNKTIIYAKGLLKKNAKGQR